MTFIACAALLASAVAFTGCKGDQNAPEQKQNAPSVTTDITISLPEQAVGGARRMPGTTVQTSASQFNGMTSMVLIPFATRTTVLGTDDRLGSNISLGDITATGSEGLYANSNSKVYTGKEVPVGTASFLFYGMSKVSGELHNTGYLEATGLTSDKPSGISFNLKPIITNLTDVTGDPKYVGLLAYLNYVADATATDAAGAWKNTTGSFKELFDVYATTKNLNSFNIERQMSDLYKSLKSNPDPLAVAICNAIKKDTYATLDGENIKLVSSLKDFPANLPAGAISVSYNTTSKEFESSVSKEWVASNDPSVSLDVAPLQLYTYPSALWYYGNTRVRTSESLQGDKYASKASWTDVLALYSAADAAVTTKTRSIALTSPVQYAVGRLDVKISTTSITLEDNNPVAANKNITNENGGYKLTGVLVGDQKNVGYNFAPTGATAYTIYDNVIEGDLRAVPSVYSAANSTLVLETAEDADVMIAIELLNNSGKDFYGADGVVPAGGKFYLVGNLKAASATTTNKKVFIQDYTTTAQLTITSLKKAYNTIPDLREPTLEIGLSVDLNWTPGSTYTVEL